MVNHVKHLPFSMISVNRLVCRRSDFEAQDYILDSGAFSRLLTHGCHYPIEFYSDQIRRWKRCGRMNAAVAQDFMCEPFIRAKTGKTILEHQALTIENYALLSSAGTGVYIMPVLQGYLPDEYVTHLRHYGRLLRHGVWVGVGSVCKRNSNIKQVRIILQAIKQERPDLKLHGFGLKVTALNSPAIKKCLFSCDSMAWSYAARKQGRNANSLEEAWNFVKRLNLTGAV